MAGHSKWANIKHKKAATDAKRGKVFSQLARSIRTVVKECKSGDPKTNAALRLLLDKARSANMPKNKIQKAIDVGLGKGSGANIKEVIYECFGPGGVGMMIMCFTDNVNRTAAEIKCILSKAGGSLGSPGSVKYMFNMDKVGEYFVTMPLQVEDNAQQEKLQKLIDDLRDYDDVEDVYCAGEWDNKD